MKTITDYKKDATLNKRYRYPEGEMTRREWLDMWQAKGATVREENRRNHVAEERLEQWIYDNRGMNSGNTSYPPTKLWLAEKARLKNGIYKTVYFLDVPNSKSLYDITKTEYDYFLSIETEHCATCGKEMDGTEHNYGTDETAGNILTCIHCYQDAQVNS